MGFLKVQCLVGVSHEIGRGAQGDSCGGALDSMREVGKAIYGGGYLLSDDAAKVRAETEQKAIAIAAAGGGVRAVWKTSERERRISNGLGDKRPRAADHPETEPEPWRG